MSTRTQSTLLTVMGDNYAEMLDSRPQHAWHLVQLSRGEIGFHLLEGALAERVRHALSVLERRPAQAV